MYFKRIEMHGFKSFAEPVVIEFHEGVTCIVGPNGSGKSNISDAIRWVLGEQSPKMLRGGKMEEVIFSGTASRKSRGMAEVTLVIDNSTGILPIDYNEVAITRRMYRSGESEYLINNNQCRLKDIRELIMDTGIGVDGYSIIGQGKIADIVGNKPESRREIFEEAAGVVMYKSKKAEAERKLSGANINLERVNDIIGEIESRIDGLKEDSIKAKEYLELKERSQELEINIALKNVEKLAVSNDSIVNDVKQLSESIDSISDRKREIDRKLTEDRLRSDNLEQLGNKARDELLEKVGQINELTNKSRLDEERLLGISRDITRLNEEIAAAAEKLKKEEDSRNELEENRKRVIFNLKNEEDKLSEKVDIYNKIMSESLKLSDIVETAKSRMYELHTKASGKRSEARSIESYKQSLMKRKEQLNNEEQEIKNSSINFRESEQRAITDMEQNNTALAANIKEISKLKDEINEFDNRINSASRECEDLRIRGSRLSARKKTIEEMESNYEGYNSAVRFIMKAGLAGIEGVVAELMHVPTGFEVAVETALGGSMQNIVCGKDNDAKTAIRLLKNNKAGRLTFLPVESVKGNAQTAVHQLKTAEGFKGMASDIISCESRYEGIFAYLLGRVAIVDNMDTAVALSKKVGNGIRFVTLEGEIINAGGAITGGKFKNQSANLLARRGEIEELATQLDKLKREYTACDESRNKLTADAEQAREKLKELEEAQKELVIKEANLKALLESIRNSSREIEQNTQKTINEKNVIESDLKNADRMAEKLVEEAVSAEKQVKELEILIDVKLEESNEVKEKLSEAGEKITAARIAKTDWDNKLDAVAQLLTRVNDASLDYRNQIADKENMILMLENEKNKIMYGSDDSENAVNSLLEEKNSLEEYIADITAEKTGISEEISKISEELAAISDSLNSYQDQKYQQEIRLAKNETQLEAIKEKLWEEYEISYAQALSYKKDDFVFSTAVKESREIRNRIKELGDVNVGSIKEYEQVSERYAFLTEQRKDITDAMDELRTIINDMEKTIKSRFKDNFDKVVVNFEEIFKELFGGGHAELRLDNEDNPLEAGIEIIAQPPGKKLQNINLMSGGEKTMTAITLMFAVLKTKPTPFCILDEVEAALDDANIDRFANYLKKFHEIQFAIVTHQKATMEHADVLYGVTMPEQGVSKVLSLRLGDKFDL